MRQEEAFQRLWVELERSGLAGRGWEGRLDEARRRFGCCRASEKVISLSGPLCELNSEEEVVDTILHEVAHALAFERYGEGCGHDERWKAICREVGARPVACYDSAEVRQPSAPWVLVHVETGEVFASFQRRPSGEVTRGWIRGRKSETFGKLVVRANPEYVVEDLDATAARVLCAEVRQAVEGVLERRGLRLAGLRSRLSSGGLDISLEVGCGGAVEESPGERERREFAAQAFRFGLTADDYGRVFRYAGGEQFRLVGLKPRNRKYPVIGCCERRGRRYKFTREVLGALE